MSKLIFNFSPLDISTQSSSLTYRMVENTAAHIHSRQILDVHGNHTSMGFHTIPHRQQCDHPAILTWGLGLSDPIPLQQVGNSDQESLKTQTRDQGSKLGQIRFWFQSQVSAQCVSVADAGFLEGGFYCKNTREIFGSTPTFECFERSFLPYLSACPSKISIKNEWVEVSHRSRLSQFFTQTGASIQPVTSTSLYQVQPKGGSMEPKEPPLKSATAPPLPKQY